MIEVELTGITPLLMHAGGTIESSVSVAGADYADEWRKTVYLDQTKTHLVIPSMNIEAMFRDASKGKRIGSSVLTRVVPVDVTVIDFEVPILVDGSKVTPDDIEANEWILTCAAVIKKNRIMRSRARLPIGWQLQFIANIREGSILKTDVFKGILEAGGKSAGLCDWRPSAPKSGKFGQFELTKFVV
jgi:hypothetical protein